MIWFLIFFFFLFLFCNFVRRAKVIWTFVCICIYTIVSMARNYMRECLSVCLSVCVWLLPLFTLTLELYLCFVVVASAAASDNAKWKLYVVWVCVCVCVYLCVLSQAKLMRYVNTQKWWIYINRHIYVFKYLLDKNFK